MIFGTVLFYFLLSLSAVAYFVGYLDSRPQTLRFGTYCMFGSIAIYLLERVFTLIGG